MATQSAVIPYSYSNLPGGFGWAGVKNGQTGSTVYTGSYNGKTVYVGPDNQPYYLSGPDAISNGEVRSMQDLTPVTWAALGVQGDPTVNASTYAGPENAYDTANNSAAILQGELPAGETYSVPTNAGSDVTATGLVAGLFSSPDASGNPTVAGTTAIPTSAMAPGLGTSRGFNDIVSTGLADGSGTTTATDGTGVSSATDPILASLLDQIQNGGLSGGGGSAPQASLPPSTVLPNGTTTSTSGGSTSSLILAGIVASLIAAAIWYYFHDKAGKKPGATAAKAAEGVSHAV